jgi:high-affinity iron transporter
MDVIQAVRLCLAAWCLALAPLDVAAQEAPARRLANIVSVAVEEYGKAVDVRGRLVSPTEYAEAVDFLADARGVASRLGGARAEAVRSLLDSLTQSVVRKVAPGTVAALHDRFVSALGPEGRLELPPTPVDLSAGQRVYGQQCASCHGARGRGDGPAARSGPVPAPAIGTPPVMRDVSPALAFRIVSVGVPGTSMGAFAGTLSAADRWNVVAYVNGLRAEALQMGTGEGQFAQRCAGCHGATGASDGVLSRALSTLPPDISSFAWQSERSDVDIARVVRDGILGRAMPAQRDLSTSELDALVAYVRHLGVNASRPQAVALTHIAEGGADDPLPRARETGRRVLAALDAALGQARVGRSQEAGDQAFDAYIAFEPLETAAGARNAGLVASMERRFAEFKAAVRAGELREAQRARDAIEAGLPAVVALARPPASGWGAFYQSFLIILREGFEAILVIGAVVTLLVKTGHRERLRAVWTGVGLALLASATTAAVLATALRAIPASREVMEGMTMLIAVAVLFSISYWLISRAEAARWQSFIRDKVDRALAHGGGRALTLVAFLAVYREGAETALFFQALFAEGADIMVPLSLGIATGTAALAVIFTLFYRYGVRVPMRPFFTVTSGLLYYMAFTFMGRGVRELQEVDVLPLHAIPAFPTVEFLGLYGSWEGLLAQFALLLLALIALGVTFWPKRSVVLPVLSTNAQGSGARTESDVGAARLAALESDLANLKHRFDAMMHSGTAPHESVQSASDEPCALCIAAGRGDVRVVRAGGAPVEEPLREPAGQVREM